MLLRLAAACRSLRPAWQRGGVCFASGASAGDEQREERQQQQQQHPVVDTVDCVVVGAGVIGLACAAALAGSGREVVLLDAAPTWGTATSARHSEVIHAGLYYAPGSAKAALCVEGKARLYEFCTSRGVPQRRIGKLIVATDDEQVPQLEALQRNAAACGVTDLQLLTGAEARDLEPSLRASAALLSPSTGILDSHAFMAALLQDAEAAGAVFAPNSQLLAARQVPGDSYCQRGGGGGSSSSVARRLLQLEVRDVGSGDVTPLRARWLVNAGGLHAQGIARSVSPRPAAIPARHLAKGNYFSLSGCRPPFSRLIYPLPQPGGLGVHLTLDLAGGARFGPDVQWLPPGDDDASSSSASLIEFDYSVDPARATSFYPAVRRFWPGLPDGALAPAYAGIRPKLSGPGQPAADFVLQGPSQHGVPGLVSLFGIESPGLTSSLAIAARVLKMIVD